MLETFGFDELSETQIVGRALIGEKGSVANFWDLSFVG
jgi:hypothetical protein